MIHEAKVVTDGAEDDVDGIAGATFEIAAAEMALCFHMSDHRLDGGAPRELAFGPLHGISFYAHACLSRNLVDDTMLPPRNPNGDDDEEEEDEEKDEDEERNDQPPVVREPEPDE
jgi:hypothetical protein